MLPPTWPSVTLERSKQALEFLGYIRPRLKDGSHDPDYIVNMDQTPVYHAMNARTTIWGCMCAVGIIGMMIVPQLC